MTFDVLQLPSEMWSIRSLSVDYSDIGLSLCLIISYIL